MGLVPFGRVIIIKGVNVYDHKGTGGPHQLAFPQAEIGGTDGRGKEGAAPAPPTVFAGDKVPGNRSAGLHGA